MDTCARSKNAELSRSVSSYRQSGTVIIFVPINVARLSAVLDFDSVNVSKEGRDGCFHVTLDIGDSRKPS